MGWWTNLMLLLYKDCPTHQTKWMEFEHAINAWQKEADSLKDKVREKLINAFETKAGPGESLKIIDTIQRLGIAYHFEEEIEQALNRIFTNDQTDDHDDLCIFALRFRLLREHGYNASSDVFTKFKDVKSNSFDNDKIGGDVLNLLNLYEASYLMVHGEVILEEAQEFTTTKLREMLPHLKPTLATRVQHALLRPMRKALPRVFARDFMSFYQEDDCHDEILLKFAKLDFNILQKKHQEELSIICSWWKNLDMKVNFPFARDRIQECYFWILGVYYEPQYTMARIFLTKILAMTSIMDDIFDNIPGIHAELELFTQAFLRWDIKAMEKLPKYMKIWFQVLIEVYDEMEGGLAKEGRSFAVSYAKEEMKNSSQSLPEESKWLQPHLSNKLTPTMEEYMKVALETSGHPMLIAASFIGMGDTVTHQAFNWLISRPRMVQATSLISRLMDDIVSHEFEQQREHVPSAVECYMQYYRVSEEEACRELYKQVENAWKDLNEAFFDPESPPMPFLTRILNFARVMDLLYQKGDGYTHSSNSKCYLVAMLVDPLEI